MIGWILPDPQDEKRAFCKVCKCSLIAHKKDLLLHSKSNKHIQAVKNSTAGPSKKITEFMQVNISKQRKIAELKIAAFIAEHCSTRTADHLTDLVNKLDNNSELLKGVKIHRSKCTALILNVIAPCLLEELISDIGNEKYSLIIDESTAIDCTKMMCVMIKYVSKSKKKVITTFYKLLETDAGDALTLTGTLTRQLKKDNLPLENVIGVGVDGANVMVGKHNSFSTQLKALTNQDLVVVKCVCHSLHLAAEHSFKTLPKHLDFLIKETHNWFSCSSKRQIEYKKLYEVMNESAPKKIDKLSGTRWLARYNAIVKILDQWDVLKLHFQLARENERCYTAQQLYEILADRNNYLYMLFLQTTLKDLITLNTAFQSEKANALKLMEDLLHLFRNYLSILIPPMRLEKVLDKDIISFKFQDYIMSADVINFGFSFTQAQVEIAVEKKDISVVRERCRNFLIELCQQIQCRLPSNIEILQKICFLTPENATSQVRRPDITSLASSFKSIICDDDVDSTVNEWNALHRIEWQHVEDPESFWIEVAENKNALDESRFSHIAKLALALLTLPFSNAAVERAFSLANIIKDKLRNRLAVSSADAIMRVRFYLMNSSCVHFEPSEIMLNKFNASMYDTSKENELVLDILNDINN